MRKNRSLAILSGSLIFCLGIYILFQGGTQITDCLLYTSNWMYFHESESSFHEHPLRQMHHHVLE